MLVVRILEDLSPHVGIATAVLPFVVAMLLRLMARKSRLAGALLSLSTFWFALNVLLAPYSPAMQQDIAHLLAVWR